MFYGVGFNNTRLQRRGRSMRKFVTLIPLCLFLLTTLGCESFLKNGYKKPFKPDTSEESKEVVAPPKSSGYLANGSTVKVDTGEEGKKTSVLEQFEQTKQALTLSQAKIDSLEKELEKEGATRTALETELEELKGQRETTQQLIIENEKLSKQLEQSQEPYEKKIKELTLELTKAQIEETRAKQELVSLKIELLMEKKKQKSQDSQ